MQVPTLFQRSKAVVTLAMLLWTVPVAAADDEITKYEYELAGLQFRLASRGNQLRVLSIAPPGARLGPDAEGGPLWERVPVLVQLRGRERMGHFGARSIHTQPSMALTLKKIGLAGKDADARIEAVLVDGDSGLEVTLRYQGVGVVGAVRVLAEVRNAGDKPVTLEQLLVCLPGMGRTDHAGWPATTRIHFAHNTWFGEAQWTDRSPAELGIADTHPPFGDSLGAALWNHIGTWSTSNYLPMGVLADADSGLSWVWQLEHTGSWQMEVARLGGAFYLAAGLPSQQRGDWSVTLQPGETYAAAPVGFGCAKGGFEQAIAVLQDYRRKACRPASASDEHLPVFFNNYMNCLHGNTSDKTDLPLIDAAAKAGAEYYVIDASWQAARGTYSIGDWVEGAGRYGEGRLKGICDTIRSKGMIPGLWLELECVSRNAKVFQKPDSWFLCANGQRVSVSDRAFFNFANPEVRAYCHGVIDRLRKDYDIGYLKLDYNADAGLGDNQRSPSLGAGQVASVRGFYQWLDEVRQKHPGLIIENCGSGGMRFEYGLLSHTHVQSTSDQEDWRYNPSIMAGALAGGLPEQVCMWSYPQTEFDDETIGFNLVVPMLCRWHLSGRIDKMDARQLAMVRAATDVWKTHVRPAMTTMTPFWPTPFRGLHEQDTFLAAGLRDSQGKHAFVTVFRLDTAEESVVLPLTGLNIEAATAKILFPVDLGGIATLDPDKHTLTVELPKRYSARLIEITTP